MQTLKCWSVFNTAFKTKIIRTVVTNNSTIAVNAKSTQNLKSYHEIPGPSSLPFFGQLFHHLPGGNLAGCRGVKLSEKLYQLYGQEGIVRLEGLLGAPDMVVLFDPDVMEYVLRSENARPVRSSFPSLEYYRHRHNKVFDPERQTGLLTDHGDNWKDIRSKVSHIFLQPKTIKLYTDVLEEVASDMIKKMRSVRDENNMIKKNLDVLSNLWALEAIGVVALGTRLNCFDPNLPENSPPRKLIKSVHDFFFISQKVDFGPSPWRIFVTPMLKKAMKIYEEQENLTKYFIDKAVKELAETKKELLQTSQSEKPILEKLLGIDVRIAHMMASDLLMAGVDTTANTAIGTLYLLATNPEKQNKLRTEVLSRDTQKSYLRACLKESIRMLPVVIGNLRLTTKEYDLLGYRIPKDVLIIFSHQYLSSLEKYYPKADEFIPERWLAEKDDPMYHGNTHRFVTSPFGYGVRMCVGRRIAELQLELFISKAMENFQIDWTGEPIQVKATSLNYLSEPFNFTFKDL